MTSMAASRMRFLRSGSCRQRAERRRPGDALLLVARAGSPARQPAAMGWRTKVSGASAVEHPSRAAAEAAITDLRARYRAGARALRVVRLLDPEGGVRLIDFAQEDRRAATALRDVERATAVR